MIYEMPCGEIVRDAMAGSRVTVFCDNATQAKRIQDGISCLAKQMDAGKVVNHPRNRTIDIGNGSVRIFLLNGYDGRGSDADVVYLSESARRQYEYASIVNAKVK